MRYTSVCLLLAVGMLGCVGDTPEPAVEEDSDVVQTAPVEMGEPVEVAEDGTEFKPPVAAAQLPPGVWYCDMGTVHYARQKKGDGRCALCMMRLKQKAAAQPE